MELLLSTMQTKNTIISRAKEEQNKQYMNYLSSSKADNANLLKELKEKQDHIDYLYNIIIKKDFALNSMDSKELA